VEKPAKYKADYLKLNIHTTEFYWNVCAAMHCKCYKRWPSTLLTW